MTPMRSGLLLLCPFLLCAAATEDPQLAAVGKTVLSLRQYAQAHPDFRGANLDVTVAKHQIRDWIESRLASFPQNGDPATLSDYLHAGIESAKLFCDDETDCLPTALGFLDEIEVTRDHEFLVVTTAVGVGIGAGTITPHTFINGKTGSGSASGITSRTIIQRTLTSPRCCIPSIFPIPLKMEAG